MPTRWKRNECVTTELEDHLIVLTFDTLKYHSLNKTAAVLWNAMQEPRTEEELVQQLLDRYSVSFEQAQSSVRRIVQQWSQQELVTSSD